MPYSTPPFEEKFADIWERCNSEVTRSALTDSSLGGRAATRREGFNPSASYLEISFLIEPQSPYKKKADVPSGNLLFLV